MWGGRPPPHRPPWSACAKRRIAEADGGVGRGHCAEQPGGPPHIADFCSEIPTQDAGDCNGYHNSGRQKFRAIGIPFVAPSSNLANRCVWRSLEKAEVRPPATPIFIVPRWVAWGRSALAAWGHRPR